LVRVFPTGGGGGDPPAPPPPPPPPPLCPHSTHLFHFAIAEMLKKIPKNVLDEFYERRSAVRSGGGQ